MAGNVREWCLDGAGDDSEALLKGGAWNDPVQKCRISEPGTYDKRGRYPVFGFRCVKVRK